MSSDDDDLIEETRRIWDANAGFWSDRMGDGNMFHRQVVAPAVERLLAVKPGQRILDLACGNGHFSRRLVELGANVVAADFSRVFLEKARERLAPLGERVSFSLADATNEAQLAALGRFDAVACNMALMDIATLDPLARALPNMLERDAPFVFSVMHPCFNRTSGTKLGAEEEDKSGELVLERWVKISRYARPAVAKGLGMIGQPQPQYYFERPIHELLGPFFRAGLVLDALEEPTFDPANVRSDSRFFSWENYEEIPPILAARLRARIR